MPDTIAYKCTLLTTGAAGALDAISWNVLVDGDFAFTMVSSVVYVHQFVASSAAAESSPDIIKPDDAGANNGRWILQRTTPIYASAAEINTGTEAAKAIAPDQLLAANIRLPMGWGYGCNISNAADTNHDITITAGKWRDATDAQDMALASALTKQFDVTWAVGTNAGGMAAGENIVFELMTLDVAPGGAGWAAGNTITGQTSSQTCVIAKVLTTTTYYTISRSGAFTLGEILTNDTATADQGAAKPTFAVQIGTLHLSVIKRSDTGVVDVLGNIQEISGLTPTLPANYDYKRRIFSLRIDASSNIINGDQWGTGLIRTWMYDTPILDVDSATPGTNAVTAALSTPGGIITRAQYTAYGTGTVLPYISSLANADLAPSYTVSPLLTLGAGASSVQGFVDTNTSSQIRYRCMGNAQTYILTLGFEDSL